MKNGSSKIGDSLVKYARNTAEFSAQRGLTEELFPYIYEASKRLSSRAISEFLMQEHKIKLSAVTIAKALRDEDKYWLALYEDIEPASRIFGNAHGISSVRSVLSLEDDEFEGEAHDVPIVAAISSEQAFARKDEIDDATNTLRERWFVLNKDIRLTCLANVRNEEVNNEAATKSSDSDN